MGWIWRREAGVDAELSVSGKVLWDKGADKIQLNKPNSPDLWSQGSQCASHPCVCVCVYEYGSGSSLKNVL